MMMLSPAPADEREDCRQMIAREQRLAAEAGDKVIAQFHIELMKLYESQLQILERLSHH